jgi:hypothetical protein
VHEGDEEIDAHDEGRAFFAHVVCVALQKTIARAET